MLLVLGSRHQPHARLPGSGGNPWGPWFESYLNQTDHAQHGLGRLCTGAATGWQQLIELEDAAVLGADHHERSEERLGYRNGYRPRLLTTQVGNIDLQIPKLRSGSFLPSILKPRRRVDQALYAVVMEAYVAALGSQSGIFKSQVSRSCSEIDLQVQAFLNRPPEDQGYAYLHGRLGRAMQV